MIDNNICENCIHILVCKKKDIVDRFDNSNDKYLDMDIQILDCKDFDKDK